MNGRSKRTTRRELARQGHKQARAAERQVLHGGHHKLVRGEHWDSAGIEQPHLDDEETRYPKKGKKKGKTPRDRCTDGGKHQYLTDTQEVTVIRYSWRDFWSLGDRGGTSEKVTGTIRYKLCVNCGKEKWFRPGRRPKWGKRSRWIKPSPGYEYLYFIESDTM